MSSIRKSPQLSDQTIGSESRSLVDQHIDLVALQDNVVRSSPARSLPISVEPFAFLSILALYLEFPATQDLFYTQICLQVIRTSNNTYIKSSDNLLTYNTSVHLLSLESHQKSIQLENNEVDPVELCGNHNMSHIKPDDRAQITDINSKFWLKYQLIICLLCSLTGPYWGGMSDRIGRITPLNVPVVSGAVCNIFYLLFAIFFKQNFISLEWLILCAIITGLSGGQGVVIQNLFGYISDHSSKEDRLTKIIILEAIIFLASSAGFFINAQVMRLGLSSWHPWRNKHIMAFLTCILLNMSCIIYSLTRLGWQKNYKFRLKDDTIPSHRECSNRNLDGPHSQSTTDMNTPRDSDVSVSQLDENLSSPIGSDRYSTPKKGATDWRNFATLKYYSEVYDTLSKPRETRMILHMLLLAGFVSAAALAGMLSLLFNYLKRDPFKWSTSQYSNWNAVSSVTRGVALVLFSVIMKFKTSWRVADWLIAATGFASKGIGLIMIGLAESSMTLNLALGAMIFSEFSMPPIRSMLSKLVTKEEVCKVYACLTTSQNFCFAIGNIVFYFAYTYVGYLSFFKITFIVIGICEISVILLLM